MMFVARHIRRAVLIALAVYAPMIGIHAYCITGRGGWDIAGVELFILIPLVAFPAALGSGLLMLDREKREFFMPTFIVTSTLAVMFIPVLVGSLELRRYGFELAARRARPVIAAIEAFNREKGHPPENLEQLIPEFLPTPPVGLPPITIVTGAKAREQFGNDWALDAVVSSGMINWDRFLYFPNQQYPESGYGGSIERIERWAYVHE